nr:LysE family transporter [Chloroflexota bacterium]
ALTIDTFYATIVVSGATPLADSARLRVPLFFAGAVTLIWLGQSSLRAPLPQSPVNAVEIEPRRGYVLGLAMGAFNPFGIVYWLSVGAALAASAVAHVGAIGSPILVGGVFGGVLLWITFLCGLVQLGRRFMTPRTLGAINAASGVVLIGFGLYFTILGLRDFFAAW